MSCRTIASRLSCARAEASPGSLSLSRDPCMPHAVGERASYRQSAGVRCPRCRRCAYYLCVCMVAQPWAVLPVRPPPKSLPPSCFSFLSCRRAEARSGGAGSTSSMVQGCVDDGAYPLEVRAPPRDDGRVVQVDDDDDAPPMPARLLLLLLVSPGGGPRRGVPEASVLLSPDDL